MITNLKFLCCFLIWLISEYRSHKWKFFEIVINFTCIKWPPRKKIVRLGTLNLLQFWRITCYRCELNNRQKMHSIHKSNVWRKNFEGFLCCGEPRNKRILSRCRGPDGLSVSQGFMWWKLIHITSCWKGRKFTSLWGLELGFWGSD